MAARRIVGLGLATLDHLGVVNSFPEKNSKAVLKSLSSQGGGPAATAMAAAARLGGETAFIGKVGDDEAGRAIARGLEDAGVDIRGMVMAPGAESPVSFVAIDPVGATRTVFHHPGTLPPLRIDEVGAAFLDGAQVLLIDGRQAPAQMEAARLAHAQGVQVLLDADSMREGMLNLLELSDVVIASERFTSELFPKLSWEERVRRLSGYGSHTSIVTLGEEGAVGLFHGAIRREPAMKVDVVDTTGCGDVYHGAFAVGMVLGYPPERCMAFAGAAAALKCRAIGGRAGLPSLTEVHALLGWR